MQLGCNPEVRNRRNKTCADLIADVSVWETLVSYVHHRSSLSPPLVVCEVGTDCDSVVLPTTETKDTGNVGSTDQLLPPSNGLECIVCCESPPTVRFEPCGHIVTCFDCAQRMKKCLKCHIVITLKTNSGLYFLCKIFKVFFVFFYSTKCLFFLILQTELQYHVHRLNLVKID